MHEIDRRLVRVAKLLTYRGEDQLTNATGFFYMKDRLLFLITNRHVVLDEAAEHRPDRLRVLSHLDEEDLTQNAELELPLYDGSGVPAWGEPPSNAGLTQADAGLIDVVAVPVLDPTVMSKWFVDVFSPADLYPEDGRLPMGQRVLVVGFPLGFNDERHNLPMVRHATVASVYGLPFKGSRYFVTDARLHRGASGSPVIAKLTKPGAASPDWFLLGVHAASLDVSNRDPSQDEPLGLNLAWYAGVIDEAVDATTGGSVDVESGG